MTMRQLNSNLRAPKLDNEILNGFSSIKIDSVPGARDELISCLETILAYLFSQNF
jgi:hypothetical protein